MGAQLPSAAVWVWARAGPAEKRRGRGGRGPLRAPQPVRPPRRVSPRPGAARNDPPPLCSRGAGLLCPAGRISGLGSEPRSHFLGVFGDHVFLRSFTVRV